ncbi:MAG: archease [bacterium]
MLNSFFSPAKDVKKIFAGKTLKQNIIFILSLKGDAHWLALSFAIGLFVGTTPFYGIHTVLILVLVSIFRFNLITALMGAWLTMPLIMPFVYYAGYRIGKFLLPTSGHVSRAVLFDTIKKVMKFDIVYIRRTKEMITLLKQLFLGCTILGLSLSIIGYFTLRLSIERFRKLRKKKKSAMDSPYGKIIEIGTMADIAVSIRAPNLTALFSTAGWALGNLLTDIKAVEPRIFHRISFQSDDFSMMMVDWLSELLYLFETQKLIFSKFDIIITDDAFSAEMLGDKVSRETHVFRHEIKAVTWHGLTVEKHNDIYKTRIIFDI